MQNFPLSQVRTVETVRSFLGRTYSWMAAGLTLTAGVAYLVAQNEQLTLQVMRLAMPLMLMQLVLVFGLSLFAHKLSSAVSGVLFMVYAVLTGLTFSGLLYAFSPTAVMTAFGSSAAAFLGMSLVGFLTKRDLSAMGRFLMFAVIGLIVAMLVNFFLHSSGLSLLISIIGVLVFAGLTAYDTQKLREMALSGVQGEGAERAAIQGALALYLDFINMFLFILRLAGGSRD